MESWFPHLKIMWGLWGWVQIGYPIPDAPWCWYIYHHLSTFGWFSGQLLANIPYMEHMGIKGMVNTWKWPLYLCFFWYFDLSPRRPRHILSWHTAYACARAWDSHHSHPKLATVQAAINWNMENQNGVMTWIIYMAQRLVVPPCHPRWWWSLYVYVYKLCVYII